MISINLLKNINKKNVIFDLDGTLIDSAPAILQCIEKAFKNYNLEPQFPLNHTLIGPPLEVTLTKLISNYTPELLNTITNEFIKIYDEEGYYNCNLFNGIPDLLEKLKRNQYNLFLATNKRIIPTLKIVDYFKWQEYFIGIYSLDLYKPPLKSKSELLAKLLVENSLSIEDTVYVGDTRGDEEAAKANGIQFMMVNWGYNVFDGKLHYNDI